jgi:hypothetical protein
MARQIINTGSSANDGTGDTLRGAGTKMNANFSELYTLVGGDSATAGVTTALTDDGITLFGATWDTFLTSVEGSANHTATLPASTGVIVIDVATQTLTNKTLTAPTITTPIVTTLKINDNDASHQYTIVPGALTGNHNINIPSITTSADFVLTNIAQTLTNKTFTSPVLFRPTIQSSILDSNGANMFEFVSTASAVNHLDFRNAATGNAPQIAAHGTDSDINIDFRGRNRGAVIIEKLAHGTTVVTGDGTVPQNTSYIVCNRGSTLNLTLADANIVGEQKYFTNKGTGTTIITPTNFAQGTTVSLIQYGGCHFIFDGTNWYLTGYSRDTDITIA